MVVGTLLIFFISFLCACFNIFFFLHRKLSWQVHIMGHLKEMATQGIQFCFDCNFLFAVETQLWKTYNLIWKSAEDWIKCPSTALYIFSSSLFSAVEKRLEGSCKKNVVDCFSCFSTFKQTHNAIVTCDSEWVTVLACLWISSKWCTYSAIRLLHDWCLMKLLLSRHTLYVHHTTLHQFTVSLHAKPHVYIGCVCV